MRRVVIVAAVAAVGIGAGQLYAPTEQDTTPRPPSTQRQQASPENASLALTSGWPAAYRDACKRLAVYARHRPYGTCPPLVPEGPVVIEVASPWSKQRRYAGGFTMSLASCSLNTYKGRSTETNGCHWAYEVGWSQAVKSLIRRRSLGGSGNPANPTAACHAELLAGARVRRCRVPPFETGGGFHGGHVLYMWDRGASVHVVSAHGYANQRRVRAMMASLIRSVR